MPSNVLTQSPVFSPGLLLVVPAAVIETQAAATSLQGRRGSPWLVTVATQAGVVVLGPTTQHVEIHVKPGQQKV